MDEEAGADVAQKVERRLQHFIDRKVATLYEPLLGLAKDETLTGLAKGFAFQMVEALGVLSRDQVADEVKALDQEARGALRKHGIRFGQFTIFMPLLLKPAPTRLRLVLWSLSKGLTDFPESPPPGLVTIPAGQNTPPEHHLLAGYRAASQRAIRIDMLERLADMLRTEDSRGGFEAKADMLSITGMTLEQFADLMQGLGYKATKGEREKKRVEVEAPASGENPDPNVDQAQEQPELASPTEIQNADDVPSETVASSAPDTPEPEVFYVFKWGGRRSTSSGKEGHRNSAHKSKGKSRGKPKGKRENAERSPKAQSFQARPPKKDRIDPDNPFAAALMGLKDKK